MHPQSPATWSAGRLFRARAAVSICFFVLGAGTGLWAVHIPLVQARLAIDPAVLGLALLTLAIGAVATMPLTGVALARFGSRLPTRVLAVAFPAILPFGMLAQSTTLLFVSVLFFGAAMGGLDVAMNTQATEVEAARGRPTMSSFHGFFSVGALSGAGIGSAVVAVGWGDGSGAAIVALVFASLSIVAAVNLLPTTAPAPGAATDGPRFSLPNRAVLGLGIVTFLGFASEGAVTDWSALFLTTVKEATPAGAGLGFAVFSVAMTVCRIIGDVVVAHLGGVLTGLAGGGLVAIGTVLAILAPSPMLAALAFAIVGIGGANIVPIAFSAAARTPGVSPAAGIAAVTTLGYSGFLIFPPLIGFAAKSFGLSATLVLIALMGLVIAAMAPQVRRAAPGPLA
jgi:MFS family permease